MSNLHKFSVNAVRNLLRPLIARVRINEFRLVDENIAVHIFDRFLGLQ